MPKIFRARRLVGTQEKADQTEMQEKEQGEMHRMLLLLGQTQVTVPLAQVEPLSQIRLKEGIHREASKAGCYQTCAFPQLLSSCTLP